MDLNYLAFFLISFIPILFAWIWYRPQSFMLKRYSQTGVSTSIQLSFFKLVLALVLSIAFVYGYMNLIIHQLGFYELFFTDIMKGSEEAERITTEFLSTYGEKHRHVGHGVLHGVLNSCLLCLPIIGLLAIVMDKKMSFVKLHFSYCLVTSMVIGGLISEFV